MLKLIKMDMYRMRKMKSFWVIWVVMVLMLFVSTFLIKEELPRGSAAATPGGQSTEAAEDGTIEPENINLGMEITLPDDLTEPAAFDIFYANIQGKSIALFMIIFTVLFATADVNNGYIKNIGGQVSHRYMLVLSKAAVIYLYILATLAIAAVTQLLSNMIILRSAAFGPWKDFVVYYLIQSLLHFALAAIIMLIALSIRNNVCTMAIAICLCMNIMVVFYSFIDNMADKMGIHDLQLIQYTVTGKISLLPQTAQLTAGLGAAAVGILFAGAALAGGCYIFTKKDVR